MTQTGTDRDAPRLGIWLPQTLGLLAGAGFALQAFINGRLTSHLDSAEASGLISLTTAAVFLVPLALGTGALRRGIGRLRNGPGLAWWVIPVLTLAAVYTVSLAAAAPKLGVALLTVALVCGQIFGGGVIDRLGLTPAGHKRLTAARVVSGALAIFAVGLGVIGTAHSVYVGLLLLVVMAGAIQILTTTGMGRLSAASGEPLLAATVFYLVAAVALAVVLGLTSGLSKVSLSAPPELYLGGVAGAVSALAAVRCVVALGALRLTLVLIAGQSVAGIVIDLLAPASGHDLTVRTVISLAIVLLAVAISGRTPRSDPTPPVAPAPLPEEASPVRHT